MITPMTTRKANAISRFVSVSHVALAATDGHPAYRVASKAKPSASNESDSNSPTRVIVADDEQIIADTLTLILNRSGFEARAVYSGEDAIDVLGNFEPDVLISDVVMSGMTGVEAAMVIRTLRPNCKVLLFSGQAATADLLQSARTQGHSFEILSKPVHPVDLLAKLRITIDSQ